MKTEEKQSCFSSALICVHQRLSHLIFLILPIIFVIGCSEAEDATPDAAPKHEHHAPHGGTAVELGAEEYHLELVPDAAAGKLQAYVLDGEMENFVRIKAETFDIAVQSSGKETTLVMKAVANRATGETVGDTSLFEAQSDWLKTTQSFDGVVKEIVVQGKTYSGVKFHFSDEK